MSSPEISDDDDDLVNSSNSEVQHISVSPNVIELSSDNESDNNYTSDEELPAVDLAAQRRSIIKQLFPSATTKKVNKNVPSTSKPNLEEKKFHCEKPKDPGHVKMIGGVQVNLPVVPYGCQIALMSQVITAIKKGQNCLLESPTGSGKTLALLCGTLAWQQHERNRLAQIEVQQHLSVHPELSGVENAKEYIASPPRKKINFEDISFGKSVFGEKSIYDKPTSPACNGCTEETSISKRQEPLPDFEGSPKAGEVKIHKKRRLNDVEHGESSQTTSSQTTPEKTTGAPQAETPPSVRLPTIYYGARTHKQLQQVVKEFSRTYYCGEALMTVLSSREHSCIREFDKQMWGTRNDMCRGCIKKSLPEGTPSKTDTNCKFYNNREALTHRSLPPAFDLEDLVSAGHELSACPYYAAKSMAHSAQIVFCPYNYLIDPGIRSNMQIDLEGSIVVIDEGHNIEDICRDAATFTFTRDSVLAAIKELETMAEYRYAASNQDVLHYVDYLLSTFKNWDHWFVNQLSLLTNKPVNNNEATHIWEMEHFMQTLDNHNIGQQQYPVFQESSANFCRKLREDPRTMYGVTQATGNLVEAIDTVLGYVFLNDGKYKNDFKPALIRTVSGVTDTLPDSRGWKNSQFNKWVDKESLSLRLLCMNPAVVFEGLKSAKCIILASGTLTPLISLHSELATDFPLQVSPNHIIPRDRVWIGSLTTCPNGRPLECNSRGTDHPDVQDTLGEAVLWVCQVTRHGVLCFLPSYMLMNKLQRRWQDTGVWRKLCDSKHVFMESRNGKEHSEIMEDYYKYVKTGKGALLFAVYRGKVSEGMDFKDHQARAVITVGVPYPNTFDMAVKEKMKYNDKYATTDRRLLPSREWLRVQAYRALNQAVGRCVRHSKDWGAVLLVDARFAKPYYTEHLSKWVRNFLGTNHHTFESLVNSAAGLESFMQNMSITENEDMDI